MENTISADDKKPILNSKEKRRFGQISEQFFKGSHEFFVEQQLKTQKFINEKLKKSSFYEHYQDSIQNIKDEMTNKIDVMKNDIKKTLGKKIMDFIIFLEIGVIAASQSPFRIESAIKTIDEVRLSFPTIDIDARNSFDSIVYFLNGLGVRLDVAEFKKVTAGVYNTAVDMVVLFANALDFFFNNVDNNAFLICLGECAFKVGEAASGAVGIILELVLQAATKSIAKRPDLRHFLTYGNNPYILASQIEMEAYSLIGRHNEAQFSSFQFGLYNGRWYGAVNENGEQSDWQDFFTLGFHRGDDEEDDIKRVFSNLVDLRIAASRASARSFRGDYSGANTVFDTEEYQRLITSWTSEHARTHQYDLQMNETATLHQIQLHKHYAAAESIRAHRTTIRNFYNSYKDSNNPIASRICREIRERLIVKFKRNGKWVEEIMGERIPGFMHSNVFVFAPLIIYAIIEFQHIQKMSSQMNLQLDMQLYAQEVESLNNIESQALSIIKQKIELFNQGIIDANTLLTDLIENLNEATTRKENWFKVLKMLRPDIIFTSFKYLPHLINSIVKPFNDIQTFNALSFWLSDNEFSNFLNGNSTMYHVTPRSFTSSHVYEGKSSQESINNYSWVNRSIVEQSGLGYDSVEEGNMFMWRSTEQMLRTISTRHVEHKKEIITLFERRKAIWVIISSIVDGLDKEKLYPELHYINGVLQRSVNTNNG